MTNFEWDEDEYGGTPEMYGVDLGEKQLAGIKVGDSIIVTDAYNDGMYTAYEDDEGLVIGVTKPTSGGGPFNNPPQSAKLLVAWNDNDPWPIDPAFVESV